jgi:hypothetical protein
MDHRAELTRLRILTFQKIGDAAKGGITAEVNRLGQIAKGCEDAVQLLDHLESQIRKTQNDLEMTNPRAAVDDQRPALVQSKISFARGKASPRQKAIGVRIGYVTTLGNAQGIQLHRRTEVIYQTRSGKNVGMPFATELPDTPDRWWLGLPDEHFDAIVLLCETGAGQLLDFVLPSEFVSEIWDSLSRDSRDNVKFSVFKVGPDYELRLKGSLVKQLRQFMGRPEALS